MVPLKTGFSCWNSFAFSFLDKVTTKTEGFVSVISDVVDWFVLVLEDIVLFVDQVRMRLILLLMAFQEFSKSY